MTRRRLALALLGLALLACFLLFLRARRTDPALPATDVSKRTEPAGAGRPAVDADLRWRRIEALRRGLRPALPELDLAGRVVDSAGAPVAGAEVVLAQPRRVARSGDDGRFLFQRLPPGDYTVDARHGARVGGPVRAQLPATSPLVVRLYRGLRVELEVVSARDQRPVVAADVELAMTSMWKGAGVHRGKTDEHGRVAFDGVSLIGHELRISAAGFADFWRGPGFGDRAGDVWRARFELVPGHEVTGRVTDDRGQPVEGAILEVVPYRPGVFAEDEEKKAREYGRADVHTMKLRGIGSHTAADGTFRLGLEPGIWVLVAQHPALETTVTEPIFAEKTGATGPLSIVMHGGARISGVVVAERDRPVPGALVEVRWQAAEFVAKIVQADGTGRFEATGLPPAPLELVARSEDARSPRHAIDLSTPAPQHERVILTLAHAGVITGTVVDARGSPVPDVIVTCVERGGTARPSRHPSVESGGPDGRFRATGLAPGELYFLSALRPQDGDFLVREATAEGRAGDTLSLRLPDDGSIVGRVEVEGGGRPTGVVVSDPMSLSTVAVGPDGRFRLEHLPARAYHLVAGGPGFAEAFLDGVQVEEGRETDAGKIVISPGRKVSGLVTGEGRQPVPEASVRVVVGGEYALEGKTGEDGRFSLVAPKAAALVVTATQERQGDSAPVAVGPTGDAAQLVLPLLPGGTVTGRVIDGGRPADERLVLAWRATARRPARPARGAVTDDQGGFRLLHLAAGLYHVEVTLPAPLGAETRVYRQTLHVEGGKTATLTFDVSRGFEGGEPAPRPEEPDLPVRAVEHE